MWITNSICYMSLLYIYFHVRRYIYVYATYDEINNIKLSLIFTLSPYLHGLLSCLYKMLEPPSYVNLIIMIKATQISNKTIEIWINS